MKQFFNLVLATVCAAGLLGGCTGKNGDPGPAGATGATGATGAAGTNGASGQNLTGSIVGYVNPVDENGGLLSKSGVVVSIEGTNPAVTATSNADGRYEFANVRNGTYNLTYTRSGLATFRRFGIGHVGGDQPTYLGTTTVSQASSIVVTNISATSSPSSGSVTINLTLNSPTPTNIFRYAVFASASSNVTPSTGTLLVTTTLSPGTTTTSTTSANAISRVTLVGAGFASGSTVYLTAFGSTSSFLSYPDPSTGRQIYPTLNTTSPTVAIVTVP